MEREKIDFVITWVDGSDKKWQEEKNKYLPKNKKISSSKVLYRDFDTLKYLFRGIEKFTPWVHKIYFVTCGQEPKWLNVNSKKLVLVDHKDFIPEQYLPTFSSHTIELNLDRINGLSEKFVYFNDDTLITDYCNENYFFCDGKPCDIAALNTLVPDENDIFYSILNNNTAVINKYFNKNIVIKRDFFKWFNIKYGLEPIRTILLFPWHNFLGFKASHMPSSLLKSTYNELWTKEYNTLNATCMNKFRTPLDVNQYLFKNWQIVNGNFAPRNMNSFKFYGITFLPKNFKKILFQRKYKMICINDQRVQDDEFEIIKDQVTSALESFLPDKSSFEK